MDIMKYAETKDVYKNTGYGGGEMFSPYLGKEYSEEDIMTAARRHKEHILLSPCDNVYQHAANSIAKKKIVGWFQGRSECGPRALGNRSILADARDKNMKDYVNARVKFREAFRPFAPSVLWEYQQEYFDLDVPSPYMLMVSDILPDKQQVIPAVTHVDGTGRLQTCMKELNPQYYELIQEFYNLTGVPVILNTSFNIQGEPIVETPEDAILCFIKTQIDILYIHQFCIQKRDI